MLKPTQTLIIFSPLALDLCLPAMQQVSARVWADLHIYSRCDLSLPISSVILLSFADFFRYLIRRGFRNHKRPHAVHTSSSSLMCLTTLVGSRCVENLSGREEDIVDLWTPTLEQRVQKSQRSPCYSLEHFATTARGPGHLEHHRHSNVHITSVAPKDASEYRRCSMIPYGPRSIELSSDLQYQPQEMFSTERLRFRAYQPADQDSLLAMFNDPRVLTYMTEGPVIPLSVDKLMPVIKDSLMFCVVEELERGAFVGMSAILPVTEYKDRNATFGIAILPSFWHKGYGWEIGNFMVDYAFQHLASHRVSLTVFGGNDRAIALYKRIGFVEEARTRKLVWIDGGWRDLIHMGILDDEWATLKKERTEGRSST